MLKKSSDEMIKFESAVSEVNKIIVMNTPHEKLRCF
jgi:hypothetical protein